MSEQKQPKAQLARRRRANVAGGRRHSHRVLVTPEEEARLVALAEAQRVTVPRLLIESTLSRVGETATQRRMAMSELFALRRVLSVTANNVNQLARSANTYEQLPVGISEAMAELRDVVGRIDATIDGLAS